MTPCASGQRSAVVGFDLGAGNATLRTERVCDRISLAPARILGMIDGRQRPAVVVTTKREYVERPNVKTSRVGEGGLEPPRPCGHRNLNPARLPIPPLAQSGEA